MEDGNLAILVDAKTEYTKQLVNILSPFIYSGIKEIYVEAKEECFERDQMEDTLRIFQKRLSEIPKWNQEVIDQEYENIVVGSKCDWLEDLIMAVFVSHTRILTSINFNKSKNKVNLKIPKVDHFIHQCYIEVARCFWKNPYLFDDTINKYEFQRNRREAEKLIENQIHETIRRQLPVKNILREYLGNEYNEVEDVEEDIENDSNYNNNLRKLVKAEIENCSKEKLDKFNINEEVDEETQDSKESADVKEELVSNEENLTTSKEKQESSSEEISLESLEAKETDLKETDLNEILSTDEVKKEATSTIEVKELKEEKEVKEVKEEGLESSDKTSETKQTEKQLSKTTTLSEDVDAALSDNEIENKEVTNIIENEVDKLTLQPIDDGLKIEELNFDFDDLNELEEVYQDLPAPTKVNLDEIKTPEQNIKLEVSEIKEPEAELSTSQETDVKKEAEPAIKTIIIDTKKGSLASNKIVNDENNLEINEFEDDEASDSEDESAKLKQKVYNRYSKKRDYSFFN